MNAFRGNPIASITLGANVTIGTGAIDGLAGSYSFKGVYDNGGRQAGTYRRPNGNLGTTGWTKQ